MGRKILVIRTIEVMGEEEIVQQQLRMSGLQPDGTIRRCLIRGLMREVQRQTHEISEEYYMLLASEAKLGIGQKAEEDAQ